MKSAYSPRTAAAEFEIGMTDIYNALNGGGLQASRKGTRWVILHDDLVEWVKSGCPDRRVA